MKKGEMMREQILQTAEELFFAHGYDQTSIQDILDQLHLSKGGFYHHFPSKEAILSEICQRHAEAAAQRLEESFALKREQSIVRVNRILERVNLLGWGDEAFSALALRICYQQGDVLIRERLKSVMYDRLQPLLDAAIQSGIAQGAFFTRLPAFAARTALTLVSQPDDDSYALLAREPDNPDRVLEALDILNAGREAVELLLGAPYGSITIYDPERVVNDYMNAAKRLNMQNGGNEA